MPLLVDCYNVLHVTMPPPLAGLDEGGLCRAIVAAGLHRDGTAVVVADGRPKPLGETASPVAGVELIYAGAERTADDVIIERIGADSAPRRLTVVTNDREIVRAAKRRRCKVLSSERLVGTLTRAVAASGAAPPPPPTGAAPGGLPRAEVDAWLERFDLDADDPMVKALADAAASTPPADTEPGPAAPGQPPPTPKPPPSDDDEADRLMRKLYGERDRL